jgi:hypothetical protein
LSFDISLLAVAPARMSSAASDIMLSKESAIMARTVPLAATARTCSRFVERLESAARQASLVSVGRDVILDCADGGDEEGEELGGGELGIM